MLVETTACQSWRVFLRHIALKTTTSKTTTCTGRFTFTDNTIALQRGVMFRAHVLLTDSFLINVHTIQL